MAKQQQRGNKQREQRQGERERQAPKPDEQQFRTGERGGEKQRRPEREAREER